MTEDGDNYYSITMQPKAKVGVVVWKRLTNVLQSAFHADTTSFFMDTAPALVEGATLEAKAQVLREEIVRENRKQYRVSSHLWICRR